MAKTERSVHAVCRADSPLDFEVGVMSSWMARDLGMAAQMVYLHAIANPERRMAQLEELVRDTHVLAISFAFSPDGILNRVDFEQLALQRAKSPEPKPLLAAAYTTELWSRDAVSIVAAAESGDGLIRAFVAVLPPARQDEDGTTPPPLPLRVITPSAGVRIHSLEQFSVFAKKLLQDNPGGDEQHLPTRLIEKLTLEPAHGLSQAKWGNAVSHLLSCDNCGEKSRYLALHASFLVESGSR